MRLRRAALVALLFSAFAQGVFAQGVPRIKAKIISFDGKVLTVTSGADAQTMTVAISPTTRYERQENRALTDIREGDYIGATVTKIKDGILRSTEIHIFPEDLRGNGEGIYSAAGRTIIDATVRSVGAGIVSVRFRGADGGDGIACAGRAPRMGGCQGSADILAAPAVPVTALVPADKSLAVPGAVIVLSVMAGPDGQPVTPGLTFEPDSGAAAPAAGAAAAKSRGR